MSKKSQVQDFMESNNIIFSEEGLNRAIVETLDIYGLIEILERRKK